MKVLFLQDVRRTARAGDVKEVKNGFARNYLLPQGYAVHATDHELQRASKLRELAEGRRLSDAKEWQDVADALVEQKVRIEVRTGPSGRLYGSVTNTMIASQLAKMTEREIDRKGIQIPAPIRAVGEYKIVVRLVEGVNVNLVVDVVADSDSIELNKQMKAVAALVTDEDRNVLDPSFEDVLAEAEAKIDAEAKGNSSEPASTDTVVEDDVEQNAINESAK